MLSKGWVFTHPLILILNSTSNPNILEKYSSYTCWSDQTDCVVWVLHNKKYQH